MEKLNILVITYWSAEDALINTYTLPYVKIIREILPESSITVVTVDRKRWSGDSVEYKMLRKQFDDIGVHWIRGKYFHFGLSAMLSNAYLMLRLLCYSFLHNIDVYHAWCTPAGGLARLLARVRKRYFIVDSFEPQAEPMVESGAWRRHSLAFKMLFRMERLQARDADAVIACVDKMKDYALNKYGYYPEMSYSKSAGVDLDQFNLSKRKNNNLLKELHLQSKLVVVYAGKFGGSYLSWEVFAFFKACHDYWGDRFRVLLLTSHTRDEIDVLCNKAQLDTDLVICRFVPHEKVPDYMGCGDFGITPVSPVPSKRYGTPIKDGEYWALGMPVVITKDISDDSDLISRFNAGYVLNELSYSEYSAAAKYIDRLLMEDQSVLKKRIRKLAVENRRFEQARLIYSKVYQCILKKLR